jgi:hypothetical protein
MFFEEPKVEFIPMEATDVTTTSPGGGGAGMDVCAPGNPNDENDFPCYGDDN